MIADLCALFPNFHGIQLVGNGLNRFLSKTRFADRGFFPAPTTGWTGIKITVLVVEAAATATSESMTSTPTPRITPIPIETASNIEPTEDCERFKPVKQQEISTPPSCNPVQITDEDIFHRFNVANISELYSLPQFLNDSFFSHQLFLSYRG
uniref:Uncharacterized protein n=1 Tax=Panagrolaimus superbus TaxID=310955 RepID=A0A914XY56_9BILA